MQEGGPITQGGSKPEAGQGKSSSMTADHSINDIGATNFDINHFSNDEWIKKQNPTIRALNRQKHQTPDGWKKNRKDISSSTTNSQSILLSIAFHGPGKEPGAW